MANKPLVQVKVEGDPGSDLRIKSARIGSWLRSAVGDIAKGGADYIKAHYLAGQPFTKRTGRLYESVKIFYVKQEKAWYLRPGVGVRGSLNYLARWVGTEKEFMKPGFRQYLGTVNLETKIAKKVEANL